MFTIEEDKKTKLIKPSLNKEEYYVWINKKLIKEDLIKNNTIALKNIAYGITSVSSLKTFKEVEKLVLNPDVHKFKVFSIGIESKDVSCLWNNPNINKKNFLNFLINGKYSHDFDNQKLINIATTIFKENDTVCHRLVIDLINKNKVLFSQNLKFLKNNIGNLNEKNLTLLAKVLPSLFENVNENTSIKKMFEKIKERDSTTYDFYWEPSYLVGMKVGEKKVINNSLTAIISIVCDIEGFKLYRKKVNEGVYSITGDDSSVVKEKFLKTFEYICHKIFIDQSIAEKVKRCWYSNNNEDLKNIAESIKDIMDSEFLTNELESINNNIERPKVKKLKF